MNFLACLFLNIRPLMARQYEVGIVLQHRFAKRTFWDPDKQHSGTLAIISNITNIRTSCSSLFTNIILAKQHGFGYCYLLKIYKMWKV